MAYASQSGRARTDPSNPAAFAVCDRCNRWYNHKQLRWQYDFRGPVLQNIRLLVCDECYDTPQDQLRAITLPADPMPIAQPRVENFVVDSTDYATSGATTTDPTTGIPIPPSTIMTTADGTPIVKEPYGAPDDIDINAIMPLEGTTAYRVQLSPLSVSSVGTNTITVTFSSAHGLSTNDQIVVQDLFDTNACGAFSITVTTATAFTYQTYLAISAGSLLTGSTLMVTANIGLPYSFTQIPQTGV